MLVAIAFLFAFAANILNRSDCLLFPKVDPEAYMNITERIRFRNYPCEEHYVQTQDGYILSMQRIRNGRYLQIDDTEKKPVVFLLHGLLDSAHTWINNLPNTSLAYILADKGFDVWLGNVRGTTYSKKHVTLNPEKIEYWKFSWDQMAKYDLPAFIYYILNVTNSDKLSYIGHSQGTEVAFAQFSQDEKLASHISSFTALGPVTTTKYIGWGPYLTLKTVTKLAPVLNTVNHGEFFQNTKVLQFLGTTLCAGKYIQSVCSNAIFWMSGFDTSNLNNSRLPVIISHTPAGTSVQNVIHYNQGYSSKKFQMFDYGSVAANIAKYNSPTPPVYDITKIKVPMAFYYGGNDILATPKDVMEMIPLVGIYLQRNRYIPKYNHMDYVWGIDAATIIYPDILDFIRFNL